MPLFKKTVILTFIFVFSLTFTLGNTSALTPEQQRIYDSGIYYFDAEIKQVCGGSEVNLSGNNNVEKAMNFFISQGFSAPQAAGIIGNLLRESGLNPKRVEQGQWDGGLEESDTVPPARGPGGQPGYGIAQWTYPSRKEKLARYADKQEEPVSSLGLQLKFIMYEMSPWLEKEIKKQKSGDIVEESAFLFHDIYESSSDTRAQIQDRVKMGKEALAKFGSGGGAATASSGDTVCSTDGSGEVVGEFSLPVAKKFFTQNPDWFTKPHHDYPAADIPVPTGTKVFSASTGKVLAISQSDSGSGGVYVLVQSGDAVFKYFHGTPGSVKVKVGATVNPGQRIMTSGNTGRSTGPHLHFEIEISEVKLCPQNLLKSIGENKPAPGITTLPKSGCTY